MSTGSLTCPLCGQTVEEQEPAVDITFENSPETREEAIFGSDEEDTLFDAYQMLRWAGVPKEKLEPVAITIELTTIYDRDGLEHYFEEVVVDERDDM